MLPFFFGVHHLLFPTPNYTRNFIISSHFMGSNNTACEHFGDAKIFTVIFVKLYTQSFAMWWINLFSFERRLLALHFKWNNKWNHFICLHRLSTCYSLMFSSIILAKYRFVCLDNFLHFFQIFQFRWTQVTIKIANRFQQCQHLSRHKCRENVHLYYVQCTMYIQFQNSQTSWSMFNVQPF